MQHGVERHLAAVHAKYREERRRFAKGTRPSRTRELVPLFVPPRLRRLRFVDGDLGGGGHAQHYRCEASAKRGTCANKLSVREDVLRRNLLDELRHRLTSKARIAYARKKATETIATMSRTQELAVYVNKLHDTISHADLAIGDARVTWFSVADAPPSLGGSPVVLQLRVADVDAALGRALAEVVFPLQAFCGDRHGARPRPFRHLWALYQRLGVLSTENIQRRRDELFAAFAARSP